MMPPLSPTLIYHHPLEWLAALFVWFICWIENLRTEHVGSPYYDRRTGRVEREQQPVGKRIKQLILYSWPFDVVDNFFFMRRHLHDTAVSMGKAENTRESKRQIAGFVERYVRLVYRVKLC